MWWTGGGGVVCDTAMCPHDDGVCSVFGSNDRASRPTPSPPPLIIFVLFFIIHVLTCFFSGGVGGGGGGGGGIIEALVGVVRSPLSLLMIIVAQRRELEKAGAASVKKLFE